MRKDMSKVIVERRRTGGKNDRKGRAPRSLDDLPQKQSMKSSHKDRKSLNENLKPLVRFLKSRVGKKWDNIYSEICENLKVTSTVQQHVKDHIWDYVYKNVILEDKKVFAMRKYYGKYFEIGNNDLYICPKSGLLKQYKVKKEKRKPYDYFSQYLANLCSSNSKLKIEEGVVYKLFLNKHNKEEEEWSICEKANSTHAKNDFKAKWGYNKSDIIRFFNTYYNRIDLKNPYFEKYLELINEDLEKTKKANKEKPSPYQVGVQVEISQDAGRTWIDGFINRIETNANTEKPTYWVTLSDTKNIRVSPYVNRTQMRLK